MDLSVIRHTRLDLDSGYCYGLSEIPLAASFDSELEQLRDLAPDLATLSMGMSNDMECALAEGATMVRIGTAIFGPRNR